MRCKHGRFLRVPLYSLCTLLAWKFSNGTGRAWSSAWYHKTDPCIYVWREPNSSPLSLRLQPRRSCFVCALLQVVWCFCSYSDKALQKRDNVAGARTKVPCYFQWCDGAFLAEKSCHLSSTLLQAGRCFCSCCKEALQNRECHHHIRKRNSLPSLSKCAASPLWDEMWQNLMGEQGLVGANEVLLALCWCRGS